MLHADMKIYIKQFDGLVVPQTATEKSAGYDIMAMSEPNIVGTKHDTITGTGGYWKSIDYIEYLTGIHIAPQNDSYGKSYHTYIFPRSSLSKYNLSLCNSVGLIDNDYRGEIRFRFNYIWQPQDLTGSGSEFAVRVDFNKIYKKGDKIGQIVTAATDRIEFIPIADLNETQRGMGGFGSSDSTKGKPLTEVFQEEAKAFEAKKNVSPSSVLDKYNETGGIETPLPYSEQIKKRVET